MSGADPYVPTGPIEQPPGGFRPAERREALQHVLRGVQLGAHDERIIDWILQWDDSTIRTVASLIERARAAGQPGTVPATPASPLDVPGRLEDHTGVLGVALARRTWPGAGETATADALAAVDAMLGELYALRAGLAAGGAR